MLDKMSKREVKSNDRREELLPEMKRRGEQSVGGHVNKKINRHVGQGCT